MDYNIWERSCWVIPWGNAFNPMPNNCCNHFIKVKTCLCEYRRSNSASIRMSVEQVQNTPLGRSAPESMALGQRASCFVRVWRLSTHLTQAAPLTAQ